MVKIRAKETYMQFKFILKQAFVVVSLSLLLVSTCYAAKGGKGGGGNKGGGNEAGSECGSGVHLCNIVRSKR